MNDEKIYFHIDVNNAFLSWTAVDMLKQGNKIDIREIVSVIGGDEATRTGIVIAKSTPAKKYNIQTGETLYNARKKYNNLKVYKSDHILYKEESEKLYQYFKTISPDVERFSVDECFLDMTGMKYIYIDIIELAYKIKEEIKTKLGYTVNIGIANTKICAKMASDFEKPDKIHTLFNNEIETKLWPVDVAELFMVGKKTKEVLNKLNINTVGQLANYDLNSLIKHFKKHAYTIYEHAWGRDIHLIREADDKNKSISTTETLVRDIDEILPLKKELLKQSEIVGLDLRKRNLLCTVVTVILRNSEFIDLTHQIKLNNPISSDEDIYKVSCKLLDNCYKENKIRLIGIRLSGFTDIYTKQMSLFEKQSDQNIDKVQVAIDKINNKYGKNFLKPASLIEKKQK